METMSAGQRQEVSIVPLSPSRCGEFTYEFAELGTVVKPRAGLASLYKAKQFPLGGMFDVPVRIPVLIHCTPPFELVAS